MSTGNSPHLPPSRSARFLRSPLASLLATVVVLLVFSGVMAGAYFLLRPSNPGGASAAEPPLPQPLRMTQQAQLNNYGWVNKSTGVARIPIDRAMEIIATQGMPTLNPPPAPAAQTPTPAQTPTGAAALPAPGLSPATLPLSNISPPGSPRTR